MKKLLCLVLGMLMLVCMLVGCGSQQATTGAVSNTQASTQVSAQTSTASTTPQASGKRPIVGFCNIAETAPQHTIIKESMEKAAAAKGYDFIYMNNKLDGQVAVSNADAMLLKGINALIEFNVDASVAPTIMEKMNAAKVPVVAVDIKHPGAVYFGANNNGVGPIVGEYLANACKTKWGGEPEALLIIQDSISGADVLARTSNIIDGFKKVFPDYPKEKVFYLEGGQDTTSAQNKVADFLSAHPDLKEIAVAPAHSTFRLGASGAIETANRQKNCLMVSQGEYDYLEYLQNNPQPFDNEYYMGTVVYDFKEYGNYCMDIVEKLLKGEKVEDAYYPLHYMIDRSNAKEKFPEYFNK